MLVNARQTAGAGWRVCPTLTPLYYAGPEYDGLPDDLRRQYNALTAAAFVDLILFFEQAFAAALAALLREPDRLGPELAIAVERFAEDERRHGRMWRDLRRGEPPVVCVGRPLRWGLAWLARRPRRFPVVVLVMLAMEELSIEMSRRCGRIDPANLDPAYAAAFREHLLDEARHVQVDRRLLAHLLDPLPPRWAWANAALFRLFLRHLWLRPARAAARVVDVMAEGRPDRRRLRAAFRRVGESPAYRRMMFSPQTSPLLVAVLRKHPAFCPAELRDHLTETAA